MDVEKCNCGAIEMEVAENQYFDEAIHHRGTARCIPLTDVADYAQLAALRDERDRAVRVIQVLMGGGNHDMMDDEEFGASFWIDDSFNELDFDPGDFDYLRQLIESEGR